MNKHIFRHVVVAALGLIVIFLVWAGIKNASQVAQPLPPAEEATTTPSEQTNNEGTMTVKIALLDYSGEKPGKQRGCDRVLLVDRTVPASPATLTAALTELFSIKEEEIDGLGNFMPRTSGTLTFDSATVTNGIAKIYLQGSLSGLAGVCDDPRAKIQIEETALQFPTVQGVELYLNGMATELQSNEKGE